MYANSASVYRADIAGAIEQAALWENNLIGLKAAPVVNVPDETGLYPVFKLAAGNLLRNEAGARAPGAAFARGTHSYEQDTFACVEYGYESAIDDKIAKRMSKFFDAEVIAAKLAKRKVLLGHEIRVKDLTFSTTNYGAATNSATAWTVSNIATFDVGYDVDLAKERLRAKGEDANNCVGVMSGPMFNLCRGSTKLQNRLRGIGVSSDSILNVDEQAVAEALGLRALLVGRAYYDTSVENGTFSGSAIWSNTYMWVGNVGTGGGYGDFFTGGAQFTINWAQYASQLAVETYRDEEHKSDIVRAYHAVDEKVVNGNAGTLIATQYT